MTPRSAPPDRAGPEPIGANRSDGSPPRPPSRFARVVLALIRTYQLARTGRVSPCRFTPTCSQYALEAVQRHGTRRGVALTVRRLGRCRPGGPVGFDPVPE
jgi:putative membrane protein insertion efficiency factor